MSWFHTPKTIQDLVSKEIKKCADWTHSAEGTFYMALRESIPLTPERVEQIKKDAKLQPLPSVLILKSEKGQEVPKDYIALAGKATPQTNSVDEALYGTFKRDAKAKTYTFIYDDKCAAAYKKVSDTLNMDYLFQVAFWNFMPNDCKKVFLHGKKPPSSPAEAELEKPPLADTEEEFTHWDVRFLLRWIAENVDKTPRPKDAEDTWPFKAIGLPEMDITPTIKGPGAGEIKRDPLLQQLCYDAGWEAAKAGAKDLKKALDSIDGQLAAKKIKPEAAEPLIKKEIDKFEKTVLAKCADEVTKIWAEYAKTNEQYRNYKIKAGFKVAAEATSLAISITVTVLAGWTGVGTVMGAVGAAKSAATLTRDCFMLAIDVDKMGKMLDDDMKKLKEAVAKDSPNLTGAKEVAAAALARLTGIQKTSITGFKTDMKQYKEKTNGCLSKAKETAQALNKLIADTAKGQKELEAKVKEAWDLSIAALTQAKIPSTIKPGQKLDVNSPDTATTIDVMSEALKKMTTTEGKQTYVVWKVLGGFQKKLTKAQKNLDGALVFISGKGAKGSPGYVRGIMEKYTENKAATEGMDVWIKKLDDSKQVPEWADKVNTYVIPLLDFAMVTDTASAIDTATSVGFELVVNGVNEKLQTKMEEKGVSDEKKEWVQFATEQAPTLQAIGSGMKDLIEALKK